MRSASSVRRRATTLERVCICVHPPFGLSFEEEQKESKLICVAATSRPELVFFLAFKTSEGTSKKVGCCDCRCVRDDEESNHEDLDKVTMSMKTAMTTVQHRVLFHRTICLYSAPPP